RRPSRRSSRRRRDRWSRAGLRPRRRARPRWWSWSEPTSDAASPGASSARRSAGAPTHEHEVVAVHDLAVVALAELAAQVLRGPAQESRDVARLERHEPASHDAAVGRDELDRVARVEVALDGGD